MERLLDEVSFASAELAGQRVVIDEEYVRTRLDEVANDTDLSRFVL
jgi:ATP-dependent HslUV protease ATP-binding subunit HslU